LRIADCGLRIKRGLPESFYSRQRQFAIRVGADCGADFEGADWDSRESAIRNPQSAIRNRMSVNGLEKFASLQDKIRLALEVCKTLRQDKERLETDLARARDLLAETNMENERLSAQVERLMTERDLMRSNIEAMLHEIAKLEMEAESLSR
jgi:chromosome segregation ATPase